LALSHSATAVQGSVPSNSYALNHIFTGFQLSAVSCATSHAVLLAVIVQSTVILFPQSCIFTALAPEALFIVTSPISTQLLAHNVHVHDCVAATVQSTVSDNHQSSTVIEFQLSFIPTSSRVHDCVTATVPDTATVPSTVNDPPPSATVTVGIVSTSTCISVPDTAQARVSILVDMLLVSASMVVNNHSTPSKCHIIVVWFAAVDTHVTATVQSTVRDHPLSDTGTALWSDARTTGSELAIVACQLGFLAV
jgi:hypothetical protein